MENNAINLKQPTPNIVGKTPIQEPTNQNRSYNRPNIGVLEVPPISKTPLSDTLELKKQENPRTAYKIPKKPNKGFKLQNFLSLSVLLTGIIAIIQLIGKKTPPKP